MLGRLFGRRKTTPEEAFRDKVVAALKAGDFPISKIEAVSELGLQVSSKDGEAQQVFLDNAFRHYCNSLQDSEAEAKGYLADYIAGFADFGKLPEFRADTLMPAIRHFGYLGEDADKLMTHLIETGALPEDYNGRWAAPFVGDLLFMLAAETEFTIAFATTEDIAEIGLSPEAALQAALTKFTEAGHRVQIDPADEDGLFVAHIPDAGWATPMLLCAPQIFETFMEQNNVNAVLISHPARHEVFFVAQQGAKAEDLIVETLQWGGQQGHRQSDYVFRLTRGGALEPYLFLPEGGALQRLDGEMH